MYKPLIVAGAGCVLLSRTLAGCDLCAVYRASTDRETIDRGWSFTTSAVFVPYGRAQFDGEEVVVPRPERLDSFIAHLVPAFNFSSRLGVSLNLPIVHRDFERTDLRYSTTAPPVLVTEQGRETGLGDAALIGRYTVLRRRNEDSGIAVDLLGGIKFPTGSTERIRQEVGQGRIYESLLPPGRPHDPLGHSISGVQLHEISAGSGSFDGVFGLASRAYLGRWYFRAQFQYYLRTAGTEDFRMGDDLMVSGGPGAYLWQGTRGTVSLQGNAAFEHEARDWMLGRASERTGGTAWYLGPQLNLTWGDHLVANAGVDIPLSLENRGFQNVPEYRVHGGVTWRF